MTSRKFGLSRRSRVGILVDILTEALDGANRTQIIVRANLNATLFERSSKFLLAKELIAIEVEEGKKVYRTTAKGMRFLKDYQQILEYL